VTPLGASGQSVGGVARAVVDYLEGAPSKRGVPLIGGPAGGVGTYYADSIEGPGRWLGAGAEFRSLNGAVDRDAFQRVLEGRHPATGERLVTARGSSQRSHLAVGTPARVDQEGNPMYTPSDVAKLLGVSLKEVTELVRSGLGGMCDPDDVGWIGSTSDDAGGVVISDSEVSRHLDLAPSPVDAAALRKDGSPDEELSAVECARLLRVSPRYIRRISSDDPTADAKRAVLPCRRDAAGRYWIRRSDLAAFAERRKPAIARVGFDLTLTVEKSIGVLLMLSTDEHQSRLVQAFETANDVAISYMDRSASGARRRGCEVGSEGLTVASYLHGTSRSLDPHPHHHNIVANAVVDDAGEVRTLDARGLYLNAPAAAALATSAFRWESRDLGLGWWQRSNGTWEVAGVGQGAIDEFSSRHAEIDEVRKALEVRLGRDVTAEERNRVALATRSAKRPVDPNDLRKDWLTRADRVGLDIGSCFERADRAIAHDVLPDDLRDRLFKDLVDPIDGLCARSTAFGRGDVMRAVADWSIVNDDGDRVKVIVPPPEVERLTARFCATGLVAEIDVSGAIRRRDGKVVRDGQDEPTFTTIELLDVEAQIVSVVGEGIAAGDGIVDSAIIESAIGTADVLSAEQGDLVRSWLTSGDRVQCAVGRAGTGKTTTMRVAAQAWTDSGYRVLGASVKGEAARLLADDAGIESDTVAMLLARSNSGIRVLDSRAVLIVDEASTIGDRDLLRLCDLATNTGATLRLIGDPAQHGSVLAGGSFNELVNLYANRTPQLATVHRLTDVGERRRADLVRCGRVDDAIDELQASGQLVLTASEHDTHAAMLARWYTERTAGRPHPMVHGRNRERRVLNALAQQLLVEDGTVEANEYAVLGDGRRLCMGDQVVARHGDRTIHPVGNRNGWMRNGTTGRVVEVRTDPAKPEGDEIDIAISDGIITCDRATFDRSNGGIDLAYAVTSYAVQGATNDVSTSAITASTSRSELYVDITRGRHHNQIYGTRPVHDDAATELDEHLPRLANELGPTLRTRLSRSASRTALGTDPTAPDTARLSRGRTLAELVAARHRGEIGLESAKATANAEAAVRRVAEHEPPAAIRSVLPECPSSPHLAKQWRATVADLAVFLAVESPRTSHDQRGLPGLIGSRSNAIDPARWDRTAQSLSDTATEIVCRQLVDQHAGTAVATTVRHRPEWLIEHLHALADSGKLARPNVDRLAALVDDVHAWRVEHDLIDGTDPSTPLGPTPTDPLGRARHAQLARRLADPSKRDPGRGIA
jgi:conjugative relaxase-like TrwC/TraI family protein